jgi:hypothetical protein
MNWNVNQFCGRAKTEGSAAGLLCDDPSKRKQAIHLELSSQLVHSDFSDSFPPKKKKKNCMNNRQP